MVNNLSTMQQTQVRSLGWEDPLEKGMATYSSILSWRVCCPGISLRDKKTTCFCVSNHAPAAAKSLQSCPTLCNSIDGNPPGSPVPEILQAGTLEWGAIVFWGE